MLALDDKGVRKALVGEATGAVDIPADLPIALEINESLLLAPAILREVNPGAIDGLVFNGFNELRIDKWKSERDIETQ
ncbi:MAG: hypothetical protein C0469_00220 [Cyanobacteria bacterium DS2.3.42]|nr:hypothetical protein [Cyanobacteria bacterium DS2.3.42]